jgi:hypothetical protein
LLEPSALTAPFKGNSTGYQRQVADVGVGFQGIKNTSSIPFDDMTIQMRAFARVALCSSVALEHQSCRRVFSAWVRPGAPAEGMHCACPWFARLKFF